MSTSWFAYYISTWLLYEVLPFVKILCVPWLLFFCYYYCILLPFVLIIVLMTDANTVFNHYLLTMILGLLSKKHCTWILTHLLSLVCSVHVTKLMSLYLICLFYCIVCNNSWQMTENQEIVTGKERIGSQRSNCVDDATTTMLHSQDRVFKVMLSAGFLPNIVICAKVHFSTGCNKMWKRE